MPFSAVTLKSDHRGGFSTSIADSIYSSATVGDSPVLSVDNSIGNSSVGSSFRPSSMLANRLICSTSGKISEVQKFVENNFKILSAMRRQCARHIFPNDKARIPSAGGRQHFPDDPDCLIEQAAFVAAQSFALACNAQVLARRTEGDDVHRLDSASFDVRYTADVLHLRQVCLGNSNRVRLHFACPHSPPAITAHSGMVPLPSNRLPSFTSAAGFPNSRKAFWTKNRAFGKAMPLPHMEYSADGLCSSSCHFFTAASLLAPSALAMIFFGFCPLILQFLRYTSRQNWISVSFASGAISPHPSGKPCNRPHSIGNRRRTIHSGRRRLNDRVDVIQTPSP